MNLGIQINSTLSPFLLTCTGILLITCLMGHTVQKAHNWTRNGLRLLTGKENASYFLQQGEGLTNQAPESSSQLGLNFSISVFFPLVTCQFRVTSPPSISTYPWNLIKFLIP
jgi:hypothetical protein